MFGYFRNTHLGHVVCMEVVFITNELHIMHRVALHGVNSLHTRVALCGANSLHTRDALCGVDSYHTRYLCTPYEPQLAMLCD